ncbi:MAG: hypothetical protein JWO41_667 [Candidatus Saccharibacteria bacterium]|nr:hypothetical protein [Candidatus Saccharibacteria bacterium]
MAHATIAVMSHHTELTRRSYVHPSQGAAAQEYFEEFKTDDRRCFRRAGLLGMNAVVLFAGGVETVEQHPMIALGLLIGSLVSGAEVGMNMSQTDENLQAAERYVAAGAEHYHMYQETMPEWLQEQLAPKP